jgi:hypothetical protein
MPVTLLETVAVRCCRCTPASPEQLDALIFFHFQRAFDGKNYQGKEWEITGHVSNSGNHGFTFHIEFGKSGEKRHMSDIRDFNIEHDPQSGGHTFHPVGPGAHH